MQYPESDFISTSIFLLQTGLTVDFFVIQPAPLDPAQINTSNETSIEAFLMTNFTISFFSDLSFTQCWQNKDINISFHPGSNLLGADSLKGGNRQSVFTSNTTFITFHFKVS